MASTPPLVGSDAIDRFVTDSGSITRLLAYLGDPTQAPHIPRPPAVLPGRRTSIRAKDTFALSEALPQV